MLAVAASALAAQEEPVLNVYNWNDYIAKGTRDTARLQLFRVGRLEQ
jgi:spermidine/putrescine-binding protein